jgi:hypothetical protein
MMSMSKHANIVEYMESFMWEKQVRQLQEAVRQCATPGGKRPRTLQV